MTSRTAGTPPRQIPRFIAVEGPIGAGKTTLARRLAASFGHELVLELADENPFLESFYRERARNALATQLFFLIQRVRQVDAIRQADLFQSSRVTDFLIEKDRLFARLNLDANEFELYETVFTRLVPSTPRPDLVIYLQAPVDTLLARVRMRGVRFEQSIPDEYLARLADAYACFFYQYEDAPLLIINSERLDFVHDASHFRMLLDRVASMRGRREFFNLGQG